MCDGKTKAQHGDILVGLLARFCTLAILIAGTSCITPTTAEPKGSTATAFAAGAVTQASRLIINFETQWQSEQSHRDPSLQGDLAAGKYLEYWRYTEESIEEEAEWTIVDSVRLDSINVYEFDDGHIKAKACVTKFGRTMHPDGSQTKTSPPTPAVCGLYVFSNIEDQWKLIGYINTMDPRVYERAPDWLKEIIGTIPEDQ